MVRSTFLVGLLVASKRQGEATSCCFQYQIYHVPAQARGPMLLWKCGQHQNTSFNTFEQTAGAQGSACTPGDDFKSQRRSKRWHFRFDRSLNSIPLLDFDSHIMVTCSTFDQSLISTSTRTLSQGEAQRSRSLRKIPKSRGREIWGQTSRNDDRRFALLASTL